MLCKICAANIGQFLLPSSASTTNDASDSAATTDSLEASSAADQKPPFEKNCAFCLGLLCDDEFAELVADACAQLHRREGYDGGNFLLALNMPITQLLRESVVERLSERRWAPASMLPKELFSRCLMAKLSKHTGLRPSLHSDLMLTVSLEHTEFLASDFDFVLQNFPEEFGTGRGAGGKRKRKAAAHHQQRNNSNENGSGGGGGEADEGNSNGSNSLEQLLTKVKVRSIFAKMSTEVAQKYKMLPTTKRCSFTLAFERDPQFIAGRYCKFSRCLPQTQWGPDTDTGVVGESVAENIAGLLVKHFGATSSRFTASGREDVDVRMLGTGRPFVVQLLNARRTAILKRIGAQQTLSEIARQINAAHRDISVNSSLARVTGKQAQVLNVGQEEKRKTYSAHCFSSVPLDEQRLKRLELLGPVEIVQKTAVRVLKRRPLLERKRTIHWMRTFQLDPFHFMLRLETQAGTYVKEFVHSDFGRTRPSLAELMELPLGQLDILQLDVLNVDLEWPPPLPSPSAVHNKNTNENGGMVKKEEEDK